MPAPFIQNLHVLSYAGGLTQWLWNAQARGETLAQVCTSGYFQPAADLIRPGDHVMVSALDGAAHLAKAPQGHYVMLSFAHYEVTS